MNLHEKAFITIALKVCNGLGLSTATVQNNIIHVKFVQTCVDILHFFSLIEKALYKIAFHGRSRHIWESLMTIKEVFHQRHFDHHYCLDHCDCNNSWEIKGTYKCMHAVYKKNWEVYQAWVYQASSSGTKHSQMLEEIWFVHRAGVDQERGHHLFKVIFWHLLLISLFGEDIWIWFVYFGPQFYTFNVDCL